MAILSLVLSVSALLFCVWLYLDRSKLVSRDSIGGLLSQSSEDLSKSYARSLREIETEWDNMYQKFSRLAGRVDKTRAIESQPAQSAEPIVGPSRSDLLRKHRRAS